MTIKDTIKSMVIMFPRLCPTKLSVYNHLFLTNGNGFRWENGELISKNDEKNCSIEDGLEALFNGQLQYDCLKGYLNITTDSEDIINYFKRRNKEKLELAKVIINYEKIINEKLYITNDVVLYPLCKYSKILNIPDDIKDDWKDAIKEFLDFIMTSEENEVIIYRNQYINELSEIQYKILTNYVKRRRNT